MPYVKIQDKAGRPSHFTEPTKQLRVNVPISHYERIKTILDYELGKLKK